MLPLPLFRWWKGRLKPVGTGGGYGARALLSSVREQALPDEKEQSPSCRLRAFVDKETGLWGLEKGDEMLSGRFV